MRTSFTVGDMTIHRLVEQEAGFTPVLEFLPGLSPELLDENRPWLEPAALDPATDMLVLCFQSYLVKTPHHTILVDSCIGNDKSRPTRETWNHKTDDYFMRALAAAGASVDDIDFVMCTHLHADHVGWNTRLDNGRWVPTFPNARYVMARREFEHWQGVQQRGEDTPHRLAFEDSVLPVVRTGQSLLVDDDYALEDGLWFESARGHTPGNVVIHARSRDEHAVFIGDVLHHQLQLARPEWSTAACSDRELSRRTRTRLIEEHAEEGTRLLPAHFPAPTVGRIVRHGRAYRYAFEQL
ncbi:MAG: MBL fold metallo-hydrolase [Stellaceae bacterium]